jgi:hypothetical protein
MPIQVANEPDGHHYMLRITSKAGHRDVNRPSSGVALAR